MDLSDRLDWVTAFEQAHRVVADCGLDKVLCLPPAKLLEGLLAWRNSH